MTRDPALILLQAAVILVAGRMLAWLGRRVRQPAVVCQMLAGIMLGPSLLGAVLPVFSAKVFPADGLGVLFAAGQVGLVITMFIVGLELRGGVLSAGWKTSAAVSAAGIAAPLVLGIGYAAALKPAASFFGVGVGPAAAAAFCGIAMSITAFPVLARIIAEYRLTGTPLGTMALGAGACDDAVAWLLFAGLLSALESNAWIGMRALAGGIAYGVFLFVVVRPGVARYVASRPAEALGVAALPVVTASLAAGAWFTNWIGLHAVLGAFLFGVAMPRGAFADSLKARLEPFAAAVLLPLFFAASGLRTRIDLLSSPALWLAAVGAFAAATAGKGVACAAAARWRGLSWAESAALGSLMNARGLMELIILNIGLERGIITPTLFTILALMAVATTLAAGPVFELARPFLGLTPPVGQERGAKPF